MASLLRVSATDEDLLNMAIKNYFANSDFSPTVQIRYRPPFIRTSTHDARGMYYMNFVNVMLCLGDAVSLAFESMIHRFLNVNLHKNFINQKIPSLGSLHDRL